MKKLPIIFLVLLFSTNAYAITFENCYNANKLVQEKIDKIKPSSISKKFEFLEKEKWVEWRELAITDLKTGKPFMEMKLETPRTPEQEKLAEEFDRERKKLFKLALLDYKDKYRAKYYDGSYYELDEWKLLTKSKTMQRTYITTNESLIKDKRILKNLGINKINKYYVKINLVTKGYIEGNYIDNRDGSLKDFFRFNLKNGTIISSKDKSLSNSIFLKKCKLTGVKNSTYLDYWWAVILILAITFFIFTQSGKRLKQIRRK
ncbi:hypothetical protein OAT08_02580 [Pelagibacteraceae bacterium]|nr:hypothetical protein [Pelagibacteraceae bacterium]